MEEPWASYILRAKTQVRGGSLIVRPPPRRWRIHRREAGQEETKVEGDRVGQ